MSGFQSLVVCTNPRSGSTMLCDLIKSTGELGDPKSFYRAQSIANWMDRLSIATDPQANPAKFEREYLDKIVIRGRGETARFSLRIMQENFADMIAKFRLLYPDIACDLSLIQKAFGPTKFIYLQRNNKVEQAVSYIKAQKSGLWHKTADGSDRERLSVQADDLTYDYETIKKLVDEFSRADMTWQTWFRANDILPIEVHYEVLARDPQAEMTKVITALELEPACLQNLSFDTSKTADQISLSWVQRFLDDQPLLS